MKVGFTGAQGTGKTTIAKALCEATGWEFVKSSSAEAVEAGYKINRDADPISQLVTTVSRISNEYAAEKSHRNVVLDRTLIDSLAYTGYQFDKVWDWDQKTGFYYLNSYNLVEKQMREYDHVFYCPIYWQPELRDDGLRDDDAKYQEHIDYYIRWYLSTMEVPHTEMPSGSVAHRLDFVQRVIAS